MTIIWETEILHAIRNGAALNVLVPSYLKKPIIKYFIFYLEWIIGFKYNCFGFCFSSLCPNFYILKCIHEPTCQNLHRNASSLQPTLTN